MHIAAGEVETKGRAHEARCKAGWTHCFMKLWYAVSPLVYS